MSFLDKIISIVHQLNKYDGCRGFIKISVPNATHQFIVIIVFLNYIINR
jgi:hypothetical protein